MALGRLYGTAFPIWNHRIRSNCRIRIIISVTCQRRGDRNTSFQTVSQLFPKFEELKANENIAELRPENLSQLSVIWHTVTIQELSHVDVNASLVVGRICPQ